MESQNATNYVRPMIEVIDIDVERGFALSPGAPGELPEETPEDL